jgi:hypothetical protein
MVSNHDSANAAIIKGILDVLGVQFNKKFKFLLRSQCTALNAQTQDGAVVMYTVDENNQINLLTLKWICIYKTFELNSITNNKQNLMYQKALQLEPKPCVQLETILKQKLASLT